MPDEPSLGEIGRNVQAMQADLRALAAEVRSFQLEMTRINHEVTENQKDIVEIKAELRAADRQRVSDRRVRFTSIIAPAVLIVVGIVAQVLLNASGVL